MAAVVSPFVLRGMTLDDIPAVSEIERESFPTMWPQTAYKRELQQNSMARYLVVSEPAAEQPAAPSMAPAPGFFRRLQRLFKNAEPAPTPPARPRLAGFIGLWFMLEECHIVTVAVREARRRQGIGELLVIAAVKMALAREQDVLTLECRVTNTGAQALYEKYGFRNVGVRKRYYTDNNEDALIMTTIPIKEPEFQALFAELSAKHRERWGSVQVLDTELQPGAL